MVVSTPYSPYTIGSPRPGAPGPALALARRQPRSGRPRPTERLAKEGDELGVVGDADRRRTRVPETGGNALAVAIDVDRERVHDRRRAPARAVGEAEVADELRRRVCRPAGRAIAAARREPAADHVQAGVLLLQPVVGVGEQRLVVDRRLVAAGVVELGLPEEVEIWLVADDHVPHLRQGLGERGRV